MSENNKTNYPCHWNFTFVVLKTSDLEKLRSYLVNSMGISNQHQFLSFKSRILVPRVLQAGGVISYPTEGVFGLGCDPFNQQAVRRLLAIKQRSEHKGFILVAAGIEQVRPWVKNLTLDLKQRLQNSWPGPVTWLVPLTGLTRRITPRLISGNHASIALRVSSHPVVRALCQLWQGPIISTSANHTGQQPAQTLQQVRAYFGDQVDYIVPGKLGLRQGRVTPVKDLITGRILRGS